MLQSHGRPHNVFFCATCSRKWVDKASCQTSRSAGMTDAHFHLKNSHFGHLPISTTLWKITVLNSGLVMIRRNSQYLGWCVKMGFFVCKALTNLHKQTFWWKGRCQRRGDCIDCEDSSDGED